MAKSKIKIALETIEALRDKYRLNYYAYLNKWQEEKTKEVQEELHSSLVAWQTCQKIILMVEDIEVKGK